VARDAFTRSARAFGFSDELLAAILRRQRFVAVARVRRSREERIAAQPRAIEARLGRLAGAVADRFSAALLRRLAPILERAQERTARADARDELEPEADAIREAMEGAARDADDVLADLDVTGELDRIARALDGANAAEAARILGIDVASVATDLEALRDFRAQAVDLIRRMPERQLERIRALVDEAAESGMRVETLRRRIGEETGIARRRAELIAEDQVLKANAALHTQRMAAAGVRRYEWSTSRDERVRPEHARLEGRVFDLDGPGAPGAGLRGEPAHPGEAIRCRCVKIPVFDEGTAPSRAPVPPTSPAPRTPLAPLLSRATAPAIAAPAARALPAAPSAPGGLGALGILAAAAAARSAAPAEAAAAATGRVRVEVDYPAEIFVGQTPLGSAPREAALPAGDHVVIVRNVETGELRPIVVRVERGRTRVVSVGRDGSVRLA
jgi:SPP1 gp7 family putative phage head morphogenesis protein